MGIVSMCMSTIWHTNQTYVKHYYNIYMTTLCGRRNAINPSLTQTLLLKNRPFRRNFGLERLQTACQREREREREREEESPQVQCVSQLEDVRAISGSTADSGMLRKNNRPPLELGARGRQVLRVVAPGRRPLPVDLRLAGAAGPPRASSRPLGPGVRPGGARGLRPCEVLSRTSRAAGNVGLPDRAVALIDAALADLGPAADPQRVSHLLVKRAVQCEFAQLDPFADLRRAAALAAPGWRTWPLRWQPRPRS